MTALINPFFYTPAAGADPYFANVVLLCHFDGANGATTFTDSSLAARSVTGGGTHVLTTAQQKFGTASLQSASTTTDSAVTADSADWHFGAGAFTIEMWIRSTAAPGANAVLAAQWLGATNLGWALVFQTTTLRFRYSTTGTDIFEIFGTYTPPLNTWAHIAVERNATINAMRLYTDGAELAAAVRTHTLFNSTQALRIGNDGNLNRPFIGQIDELRITNGIGRYGGAFTPPTAPFPDA